MKKMFCDNSEIKEQILLTHFYMLALDVEFI